MPGHRVTYICQHFSLPTDSGNLRMWEFARRLQDDGYRVTVVRGGDRSDSRLVEGVQVRTVPARYANEMSFSRRIFSFVQFMFFSCVLAVTTRPDLIVASSTPLTVAVPTIIGGLRRGTKVIFEVRDLWPELPVKLGLVKNRVVIKAAEILERGVYKRSDVVVALSPYMENGVRRAAPGASTVTIPNGCDFEKFDSAGSVRHRLREEINVADDEVLVVYAGGFGYLYDLSYFVEIAGLLNGAGVKFAFIGQGSESELLQSRARELGLNINEVFLGRKPKAEVIEYLVASDINISSLRAEPILEGCSLNKVFDAMAAGRPLLMNHGGWLTELVVGAEGGWRLPSDPHAAADVLGELLSDKKELARRGRNNYRLGRQRFDRDDQYRLFLKAVNDVMAST